MPSPNLRLTSYSRATFPLESLTNGNVPPSDSPNLCRRSTLSVLAPTVTVFANANCPWSFTNSLVSRVQPRVNALRKKKRTTFEPRQSDRVN